MLRSIDPDIASAAMCWEAESSVRSPIAGDFVENDIASDELDVGSCYTLSKPLGLHLKSQLDMLWCLKLALVVGTAQTLKLYGRMKILAIPSPTLRIIQSSKSFGFVFATLASSDASIKPSRHVTWSSLGSIETLF